ncbi:hypothetical protein [Streptomyces sp. NPDC005407]|uniref:hypothetical protein n=1 Tax=Streptomyces sp. NPDC005407 TaxID=3155340 RepID=UPI0033ACCF55
MTAGPQSELLVARSLWRLGVEDLAGAANDLLAAVRFSDQAAPDWAGRSRRAARGLREELAEDAAMRPYLDGVLAELSAWATEDLDTEVFTRVNEWLAADSWASAEEVIRQAHPLFANPAKRAVLDTIQVLYPEATGLGLFITVVDAGADGDLEQVLREYREIHDRIELVGQWLGTSMWTDDLAFLQQHRQQLAGDPAVRELLADNPDNDARQHLAILKLADHLPLHDLYDAVVDPSTAVDMAMECIERRNTDTLLPLLDAAPSLLHSSFVTPYVLAVLGALADPDDEPGDDLPSPAELMAQAAEAGSDVQRGAGAARLRRLAERRPEHAAVVLPLIGILTEDAEHAG